jgi:leucyl-tRNA synthetase
MDAQYDPEKIENSVQAMWDERNCFQAIEEVNKEKFYCVTMFPYPSGKLHIGHTRVYTIGDVISRYQRMLGKNVLQPMGWDAFGLPAENAAIQHKIPAAEWTKKNIAIMRTQMQRLGFAYDWSRELTTCEPSYYGWEQWFFLQLFKKGLVYKKNAEVNWDPVDQTILANEQVIDGRGWRSGALVERREIPQWFLKITAYADELLTNLDKLPAWPEQVRTMQRNWIGRSEGLELQFPLKDREETVNVYTTRADTVFGVSFIVIAAQHPLAKIAATHDNTIQQFLDECRNIKVAEAELATIEKRGVPTGLFAIHPFTKQAIPIWIGNFVVMGYGTGAVMAVPAHDLRDFEFAQKYLLPTPPVIMPLDGAWDFAQSAYTGNGLLINSAQFNNLPSEDAKTAIIDFCVAENIGTRKVNFRLRDWSVSRQRYWGTPIPMINCATCGTVAVCEKDLPIVLPTEVDFNAGKNPLKTMPEFYETNCPQCGSAATRETDTFDTFFESSWYYTRYACKKQDKAMLDGRANYWAPVDQYVGGVEHAVLHLLYARFIHKTLRDEGLLNSDEPFTRLLTQGMVLNQGIKMSKSKGNVVDPETLIAKYGADTVRLFIIFAAPPEQNLEWSDSGVDGAHRFLKRLWAFAHEHQKCLIAENYKITAGRQVIDWDTVDQSYHSIMRQIYEILAAAQYDYERLQLNTVVSSCMKLFNLLAKVPAELNSDPNLQIYVLHKGLSILLRLLAPIVPHMTQAIWHNLHFSGLIIHSEFPKNNANLFKADELQVVIQINGKLRTKISVPSDADAKKIEELALLDSKVQTALVNKLIKKIIVVRGKLVNIVTGDK